MKPFVLDRDAAKRDLRVIEQELRDIKNETRPRRGPVTFRSYLRNGHAVVERRRELLSYGKSLTSVQGQRFRTLKYQATLICTALAHARSNKRFHRSAILRHPESLLDLAACMRIYEKKEPPVAVAVESEVEPVQTVEVFQGGTP